MKRGITTPLCLLLASLAWAQDEGTKTDKPKGADQSSAGKMDAVDIIKKADAATRAVKSVRYRGKVEPSPAVAAQVPVIEGIGVMAGEQQNGLDRYRLEVAVRWPGSEKLSKYVTGSDRDIYYLTDVGAKTVYADLDPAVVGRLGTTINQLFAMREYCHPSPFADELNGDLIKLVGTEKVGDEECHRVHVVYSSGRGEAYWCFSKKDYLPRRVERILRRESVEPAKYTVTATEVVVDPKLPEDPFKLAVPEGFTRTDAFAPDNP